MKWTDCSKIAQALQAKYPATDLGKISDAQLLEKVVSLNGFDDTPTPANKNCIPAILNAWIAQMYPNEESERYSSADL